MGKQDIVAGSGSYTSNSSSHLNPYCHTVSKYDFLSPGSNILRTDRISRISIRGDEMESAATASSTTTAIDTSDFIRGSSNRPRIDKFNRDEWKLRRQRQKTEALLGLGSTSIEPPTFSSNHNAESPVRIPEPEQQQKDFVKYKDRSKFREQEKILKQYNFFKQNLANRPPSPCRPEAPKELPKETTPEPKEVTPEPPKEITPEPLKEITPEPKEITPVPKEITPEPKEITPEPEKITPEPKEITPVPENITPEPKEVTTEPEQITPEPEPVVIPEKVIKIPPSIEEMQLNRLSRKTSTLITKKEELIFKTKTSKELTAEGTTKSISLDKGLNVTDLKVINNKRNSGVFSPPKPADLGRKLSLPANALRLKSKPVHSWVKDRTWLEAPWNGVANPDKINQLKTWLEDMNVKVDRLENLRLQYDVANNPPQQPKFFVSSFDPYVTLKTEEFTLLESEDHSRLSDENHNQRPQSTLLTHRSGFVTLTLKNGDVFSGILENGTREGWGRLNFKIRDGKSNLGLQKEPVVKIEGVYDKDVLQGPGKVVYQSGDVLYCDFIRGVPQGPGKLYDSKDRLKEVGWLENGKFIGLAWKFLEGGGYLTGNVDMFGNFTGDNFAHVYPNLTCTLAGSYTHGQLMCGQFCYVTAVKMRKGQLPELTLSTPQGPLYNFDTGTETSMCDEPMIPDPYEQLHVYVMKSHVGGAGEGLFSRENVDENTPMAFYNGIRMTSDQIEDDKYDWEINAYKIMDMKGKDPKTGLEGVIDIAKDCIDTKNYVASMAHKANHSFEPNAKFVRYEHPRFGLIPCVTSIKPIKIDDEVTVSYDYALEDAPPWYQYLYAKRVVDSYRESKNFSADKESKEDKSS